MDAFTRAYYEVLFERDFLKKTGDQFQDFFAEMMEKCHPRGDFMRVRPWGSAGDRKNDGYLRSERTLFQVYAPNEMTAAAAVNKIDDDFYGALPYWKQYFDLWTFTHNSRKGLGPDITNKLLELSRLHRPLSAISWGFEELRERTFRLTEVDLASFLGPAPSSNTLLSVGFPDVQVVLQTIEGQTPPVVPDLRPIPPEKLDKNGLSEPVRRLLREGQVKSTLVRRFFQRYHDPQLGDRVASAFRGRYEQLKSAGQSPDLIFQELQAFAGGMKRGTPQHEAAVITVLAYLFEECDIFERPTAGPDP